MKSLLVVGLDGATFDVLDPYVERHPDGQLARIRRDGTARVLESTLPYFTGPAWTTFMTGLGPEQHGVYHWRARFDPATGNRPLMSTRHLEQASYWWHAQRFGASVSITNFPMMYPAPPTEGVFVCGTLALEDAPEQTWPPQLSRQLKEQIPGYRYEIEMGLSAVGEPQRLRDHILEVGRHQVQAALEFGQLDRADLAVHVVTVTDRMQHFFWDQPGEEVMQAYALADRALAELLSRRPWDAVVVVSDHGAGPSEQVFQTDEWLVGRGWARRASDGGLDFTSSWAYAGEEPEVAIYVNRADREGFGVPANRFDDFLHEMREALLEAHVPGHGVPVFRDVVLAQERPEGPFRDLGPDVLLLPTSGVHPRPGLPGQLFTDPGGLISGHRPEGVLMLAGGDFDGGGDHRGRPTVHMAEMFSLLSAAQGIPVPRGVPLSPLLEEFGVPYMQEPVGDWSCQVDGPPSRQAESPGMLDRLRELGYL